MIEFYCSEELGLLEEKKEEFKLKNPLFKTIKNPNIQELSDFLFQIDLFNDSLCFLVEGFKDRYETLDYLFNRLNVDNYNIIFIVHIQPHETITLSPIFKSKMANAYPILPRLNEKTKKGFINKKINRTARKLSTTAINEIKSLLPPDSCAINEFFSKLSMLHPDRVDLETIRKMCSEYRNSPNYFEFLFDYMFDDDYLWIEFMNRHLINVEEFFKFMHCIYKKLYDCKVFLTMYYGGHDLEEIAKELQKNKVYFFGLIEFLKLHGKKVFYWIDQFIIDLYFFQSHLSINQKLGVELMKFFLLKEKEKFQKW